MNRTVLQNNFSDVKSGIALFLVALPLSLGVAMECNVPLFSGIIAGVIGGLVGAAVSGSKYSVAGPAGGLIIIIISSIAQLGSYEAFLAALVFAGIFQLLLGFVKAGDIGMHIPNSVIKGMLVAAGILLIIKQTPYFLGYEKVHTHKLTLLQTLGSVSQNTTPGVLIIGIISLVILIIADKPFYKNNRFLTFMPGPFLAVLVGILLNEAFDYFPALVIGPRHLIDVSSIAPLDEMHSNFTFPSFDFISQSSFWGVVFTIGIVASLETVLRGQAIDKLDPEKKISNNNKELIGQGLANIFCGLVGGLPVTTVVARSSVNINSGAKTKFSVIFHAILLAISVILFPKAISLIPNTCLAALLIYTGYKLVRLSGLKQHLFAGPREFIPFFVTILFMLQYNLLTGVFAGFLVAVVFIVINKDKVNYFFETSTYTENGKTHRFIKLPQHVTVFNKGKLVRFFESVNTGNKVIIDGSHNENVNGDAKEIILDFVNSCKKNKIEIEVIKFYH
jgi:MFS superfamily sulfate permease-like transporter